MQVVEQGGRFSVETPGKLVTSEGKLEGLLHQPIDLVQYWGVRALLLLLRE